MTSGTLHVIDATFTNNQAADTGPDVAGGAIYTTGSVDTTIVGSQFAGNSASNGGAVGSLNSDLTLINDSFTQNQALGQGANSTNGDVPGGRRPARDRLGRKRRRGVDRRRRRRDAHRLRLHLLEERRRTRIGGAIFRTPDGAKQTSNIDRTTFDGNTCSGTYNGKPTGQAGAMYFHNSHVVLTNSTVSNNSAPGSGGFFGDGTDLDATNVTFASNVATTGVGGAIASTRHAHQLHLREQRGARHELRGLRRGALRRPLDHPQHDLRRQHRQRQLQQRELLVGHVEHAATTTCSGPWGAPTRPCVPSITFADAMLGPLADNGGHHADREARRRGHGHPDGHELPAPPIRPAARGPIPVRSARSKSPDPTQPPARRARWPSSSTNIRCRPTLARSRSSSTRRASTFERVLITPMTMREGDPGVAEFSGREPAPRSPVPGRRRLPVHRFDDHRRLHRREVAGPADAPGGARGSRAGAHDRGDLRHVGRRDQLGPDGDPLLQARRGGPRRADDGARAGPSSRRSGTGMEAELGGRTVVVGRAFRARRRVAHRARRRVGALSGSRRASVTRGFANGLRGASRRRA